MDANFKIKLRVVLNGVKTDSNLNIGNKNSSEISKDIDIKLLELFKKSNPSFLDKLKDFEKDVNFLYKQLELEKSRDDFPLCPFCQEEFKDLKDIITHLQRKKKESEWFLEYQFDLYNSGLLDVNINLLKKTEEDVLVKNHFGWSLRKRAEVKKYFYKLNWIDCLWKGYPNVSLNLELVDLSRVDNLNALKNVLRKVYVVRKLREEKYAEWKGEKKKRVQKRESPVPQKLRFEILKRDNFTCQYCGRKAPEVTLEVDHIEPYSKTKDNSPENLIASCLDCNRGKRTKDVI